MEELDIQTITRRSIHGVFALVSRTFLIQLISQVVTFLLTIYLSPNDYGLFFIVSAVIVFLSYFSDVGLAAALIQKKEPLTREDLVTTFTIQQVLVVVIVIVALLSSPFIASFYDLDQTGLRLFQALVVAFFLSSLKTIPSIILERSLQFHKLVIPEIVETLFFNITVLVLAIQGFGVSSFTYAVLLRGLSGFIAIYVTSPWKMEVGFSRNVAKRLLKFGVPFQLNSFLALLKDNLLIIYLGKVLPLSQVGYIGFAQKWAVFPLRLVMDNIIRITFPSFSRLAHENEILGRAIEKAMFATVFLVFPALSGMVLLLPYFIQVFPKYEKWEPAMFSLSFFAINASLSALSTPLVNALNAIGKIKVTLYLMVFWTIATWVLTPLFIQFYGYHGVAIAAAVISISVVGVIFVVKRYVHFEVLRVIVNPLIATVFMSGVLLFLSPFVVYNLYTFLLMVIIGSMIYVGTMYLLAREQITTDMKIIAQALRR